MPSSTKKASEIKMTGKTGRLAGESVSRYWPPADFKRSQEEALLLPVVGIIFRVDVLGNSYRALS